MTWRDDARALCDECQSSGLGHAVTGAADDLDRTIRQGRRDMPTDPDSLEVHRLRSLVLVLHGASGLALELGAWSHWKQARTLYARAADLFVQWSGTWAAEEPPPDTVRDALVDDVEPLLSAERDNREPGAIIDAGWQEEEVEHV